MGGNGTSPEPLEPVPFNPSLVHRVRCDHHLMCLRSLSRWRRRTNRSSLDADGTRAETTEKIKIVVLGVTGVGKTTLFRRLMGDHAAHESSEGDDAPSTSANIGAKLVLLEGLPQVVIEVWDVPSQLYAGKAMFERYVTGAQGLILVYSLEHSHMERSWQLVCEFLERNELSAVVVVAGNKCDLKSETTAAAASTEAIRTFCEERNALHFEISARENSAEPLRVAKALLERIIRAKS